MCRSLSRAGIGHVCLVSPSPICFLGISKLNMSPPVPPGDLCGSNIPCPLMRLAPRGWLRCVTTQMYKVFDARLNICSLLSLHILTWEDANVASFKSWAPAIFKEYFQFPPRESQLLAIQYHLFTELVELGQNILYI